MPLLEHFPDGLTTQEVAALLTDGNDAPDRLAAERALLELVAAGARSGRRSATMRSGCAAAAATPEPLASSPPSARFRGA